MQLENATIMIQRASLRHALYKGMFKITQGYIQMEEIIKKDAYLSPWVIEKRRERKKKEKKMIACLLVLRDGKPTGTINLQRADCFANETAS